MQISRKKSRTAFREPTRTARLNRWYLNQLLKVCDQIAGVVSSIDEKDPILYSGLVQSALNAYAGTLTEWATDVSAKMIQEAADADYQVWLKVGQKISRATRELLKESGTSDVFRRVQSEEVDLIRSLPLEAAIKVQEWTKEGLATGERFEAISKRILDELPPITRNRAICIARTETARARSNFTQARARNVGSPGYIWHTVGDSRVRPMHAALDGTYQTWDNPPVCDVGRGGQPLHAHAGCIFNCRCWSEPVWPEELQK